MIVHPELFPSSETTLFAVNVAPPEPVIELRFMYSARTVPEDFEIVALAPVLSIVCVVAQEPVGNAIESFMVQVAPAPKVYVLLPEVENRHKVSKEQE